MTGAQDRIRDGRRIVDDGPGYETWVLVSMTLQTRVPGSRRLPVETDLNYDSPCVWTIYIVGVFEYIGGGRRMMHAH